MPAFGIPPATYGGLCVEKELCTLGQEWGQPGKYLLVLVGLRNEVP